MRQSEEIARTPGREDRETVSSVGLAERPEGRGAGTGSAAAVAASVEAQVARRVGEEGYKRYFSGRTALRLAEGGLEVTVPTRFMADLMQRRFGPALREAARDSAGGTDVPVRIRVAEVGPVGAGPMGDGRERAGASSGAGTPTLAKRPAAGAGGAARAKPRAGSGWCRLDDFVVGESNRLAYTAALRLAEGDGAADGDGTAVTRLFVHGGCGLGKTHLLQGIARRFRERRRNAVIRYITGEAFTNEFVAAVRGGPGQCERFRKAYRGVDLLCIDDVHFLANKQATQKELLHTFDAIGLDGARVVLASDEHPRQVRSFSEALVSRFMAGLVVKLSPPERDLRERIVRAIAVKRGLALDDGAVRAIAAAGEASAGGKANGAAAPVSIRDLEGMVTRVEAVWRLVPAGVGAGGAASGGGEEEKGRGGAIGLLAVRRAMTSGGAWEGGEGQVVRRPIRVSQIMEETCRVLGVELGDFTGRGRHPRVVLARAVVSVLSRRLTTSSFPEIARAMGRPNHSTIVTAYQRLMAQIEAGQGAGLEGELAGLTVGEVCERVEAGVR